MEWIKATLTIDCPRRGMHEFTRQVEDLISQHKVREGMCYLFIPHTSASLAINENADPTARRDMEAFLERVAPEGEDWHVHTLEGPDDSPSHMRAMVTRTSEVVPVDEGRLNMGTWQGIYVCEHRKRGHRRRVTVRILKMG